MLSTGKGPHVLRVHGQSLAEALTVPATATRSIGTDFDLMSHGLNGAMEAVIMANGDVTVPAGTELYAVVEHSDNGTDWMPLCSSVLTNGDETTIKDGGEVGRVAWPSTVKQWLRAGIESVGAGATGTVDIVPVYLPR